MIRGVWVISLGWVESGYQPTCRAGLAEFCHTWVGCKVRLLALNPRCPQPSLWYRDLGLNHPCAQLLRHIPDRAAIRLNRPGLQNMEQNFPFYFTGASVKHGMRGSAFFNLRAKLPSMVSTWLPKISVSQTPNTTISEFDNILMTT